MKTIQKISSNHVLVFIFIEQLNSIFTILLAIATWNRSYTNKKKLITFGINTTQHFQQINGLPISILSDNAGDALYRRTHVWKKLSDLFTLFNNLLLAESLSVTPSQSV